MSELVSLLPWLAAWLVVGFLLSTGRVLVTGKWKGVGHWLLWMALWPFIFFSEGQ